VAPSPTTAFITESEIISKEAAGMPPKLTVVVPEKCPPVIVTLVPGFPDLGLKELIKGRGGGKINVKPLSVSAPIGVVTIILPDPPVPTIAVIV
jgi:hypothetical protein